MYNTYFETTYSEFWKKQSQIYGKQEDDGLDKIIEILKGLRAKTAFEVGIGTGWPIASDLSDAGTSISGCDVAESLIKTAQENYPQMKLHVGDIWHVPFEEKKYDLVYCIRSSWYMKDFPDVILKMLEVTDDGGTVVFNILNSGNSLNKRARIKSWFIRFAVRVYGAMKVLFCNRDYIASCPSYYYNLEMITEILNKNKVQYQVYSTNQLLGEEQFMENSQKLLFVVRKVEDMA
ncbi:MAG: class I SAM-dependent methyltransferase [Lachnospiraceae bacterium]|nr:class I SAM-dependent methyltransferase [Lachnospiraceae bacterium]